MHTRLAEFALSAGGVLADCEMSAAFAASQLAVGGVDSTSAAVGEAAGRQSRSKLGLAGAQGPLAIFAAQDLLVVGFGLRWRGGGGGISMLDSMSASVTRCRVPPGYC